MQACARRFIQVSNAFLLVIFLRILRISIWLIWSLRWAECELLLLSNPLLFEIFFQFLRRLHVNGQRNETHALTWYKLWLDKAAHYRVWSFLRIWPWPYFLEHFLLRDVPSPQLQLFSLVHNIFFLFVEDRDCFIVVVVCRIILGYTKREPRRRTRVRLQLGQSVGGGGLALSERVSVEGSLLRQQIRIDRSATVFLVFWGAALRSHSKCWVYAECWSRDLRLASARRRCPRTCLIRLNSNSLLVTPYESQRWLCQMRV